VNEIMICPVCRTEYDLAYSMRNDEEVVTQSRCKCSRQNEKEKLDKAINSIAVKYGIKIREVSNAKDQSSTRKVSR
jgi:uncharacterized protein YbaR (Trm112 family)